MRGKKWVYVWIKEYGYDFVQNAVEQAIDRKQILEIHREDGEARIKRMAKEMGVRLE